MRVLLPFFDDSSLFTAKAFHKILIRHGIIALLAQIKIKNKLSERQLSQIEHYIEIDIETFYSGEFLSNFDFVIYSKIGKGIFDPQKITGIWKSRPCFIATFPGIYLTPEKGIYNRRYADVILFTDSLAYERGKQYFTENNDNYIFHPFFCYKDSYSRNPHDKKNIYFFAQAMIPNTLQGRLDVLRLLKDMALLYPEDNIFLKLRNLSTENAMHAHKEMFSYEYLYNIMKEYDKLPRNLSLTTDQMDIVLSKADYCITCCSTAGIESLSYKIPTSFFTGFDSCENDPWMASFEKYLAEFDIFYKKEDILKKSFPDNFLYNKLFLEEDDIINILNKIGKKFSCMPYKIGNQKRKYNKNMISYIKDFIKGEN